MHVLFNEHTHRLCVNTRSGVWRQALSETPGIAISVMAHEHYHLVQDQLCCLPPPWRNLAHNLRMESAGKQVADLIDNWITNEVEMP